MGLFDKLFKGDDITKASNAIKDLTIDTANRPKPNPIKEKRLTSIPKPAKVVPKSAFNSPNLASGGYLSKDQARKMADELAKDINSQLFNTEVTEVTFDCTDCGMDVPEADWQKSTKCSYCELNYEEFYEDERSMEELEQLLIANDYIDDMPSVVTASNDLATAQSLTFNTAAALPPLTNVNVSVKVPLTNEASDLEDDMAVSTETLTREKVATLIPNAEKLLDNGFNVMLIGKHGTGKTESVRELAASKGLKLKAYSCATLDPFTDLVGVPVPKVDENGKAYLEMVRPVDIDEADIVFFDELNRSRPEVQDAVLEIINNRTINGEPLPNLKACWAAINPPNGDYNVDELDPALMDRFDVYIEFTPRPSAAYMSQHVSMPVAKALKAWYDAHDRSKRKTYISPRRLMKIGLVYEATKNKAAFMQSLPPGADLDSGKLWQMLDEAAHPEKAKARKATGLGDGAADFSYDDIGALYKEQKKLVKFLKDNPMALDTHKRVAKSLSTNISGTSLVSTWSEVLNVLNKPVLEGLVNGFSQPKQSLMRNTFRSMITNNKARAKKLNNLYDVIDATGKNAASKLPTI